MENKYLLQQGFPRPPCPDCKANYFQRGSISNDAVGSHQIDSLGDGGVNFCYRTKMIIALVSAKKMAQRVVEILLDKGFRRKGPTSSAGRLD